MPALFAGAVLSGCASIPAEVREYGDGARNIELTGTPFFPQERYQCGPAALMTVLTQSGAAVTLESLVDQVYLPGRQGSLQTELLAATRAAGRIPYPIEPSLRAVAAELEAGRPVLVLQNLGVSWYERWHYAVVVGVNPAEDTVVLRSGTERRHLTDATTFLRTWRRSDYWALVVLRPGELPENPDRSRYLPAVAALEETGHIDEARAGFRAALTLWPDDAVALFGLANTEFALGRFSEAESLYRQLLEQNPSRADVRNNLAYALARQGMKQEAEDQLRAALELAADDDRLRQELEDSLREIQVGP